ncbi:MAG: ribonuclease P protein component [Cellvibrionaceae bacterium]|jgi:ribonuclease P protein component
MKKPTICRPLSFPKSRRLLSSKEFEWVFADASVRASNQHCLILSRPNDSEGPKLGLIIAKKHVRLAVERNRIKRIIRESFRQQQHQLPTINAIVLARKGLDKLESKDIHDLLELLWQKIRKKALRG